MVLLQAGLSPCAQSPSAEARVLHSLSATHKIQREDQRNSASYLFSKDLTKVGVCRAR